MAINTTATAAAAAACAACDVQQQAPVGLSVGAAFLGNSWFATACAAVMKNVEKHRTSKKTGGATTQHSYVRIVYTSFDLIEGMS